MATAFLEDMSICGFAEDYDVTLKMPLDEFHLNELTFEDVELIGRKEQSIQGDVAKIAASGSLLDDFNDYIDIKPDIRNGDCMWSAFGSANTCHNSHGSNSNSSGNSCHNNSNSAASSYSESSAVPPSIVSGSSTVIVKHELHDEDNDEHEDDCGDDNVVDDDEEEENMAERCNSNNGNKSKNSKNNNNNSNNVSGSRSNKLTTFATSPRITITPRANNKQQSTMRYTMKGNNSVEHIPPGASLLRKSNPAASTTSGACWTQVKDQQILSVCRRSVKQLPLTNQYNNNNNNNNNNRFSLDGNSNNRSVTVQYEDAAQHGPVFRHNVDLAACLMGSNNISLTSSSYAINCITRELQNDKSLFDRYPSNYKPEINEVIDVIKQEVCADAAAASSLAHNTTTAAPPTATATTTTMSPPASNSDCDSDDGDCSMVGSNSGTSSYMHHISDHSYTRSEMEATLETPSDTDDEIDVVSLPDNKLPTNPSDRDRRALQTQVANKMSTLPARGRYELPYTPASSSPVKSEANSRFPSPSSTPYQGSGGAVATVYPPLLLRNSSHSSHSSNSSSSGSDCATPGSSMLWGDGSLNGSHSISGNKSARKRYQDNGRSSAYAKQLQSSKKSRAKLGGGSVLSAAGQLQKQPTLGANNSHSLGSSSASSISSSSSSSSSGSNSNSNVNFSIMKRQFSLDEADTIEKRNLHNDMERQRRIGLKNLFEALKKQIPNIRDKERAPKVNILREAAKLCEQLTSEERDLSLKRQLLKAKQKQRHELIARLRLSANAAE